jgi:quercetin dioxygenase-like cupin family protein
MKRIRKFMNAAPLLALSCLLPLSAAHAEADSLLTFKDLQIFKMYHAYSASDGKSYIEEMDVPAAMRQSGTGLSQTYFDLKPSQIIIGRQKAGAIMDWHGAVQFRHLIIPMQGNLMFDAGDGRVLELKPGEAIYAEDWTGRGHRSGCSAKNTVETCVGIDILIDANPHGLPLRAPPQSGK